MSITVKAPAKINLSLDIGARRDDGYHLIETVMQAVSLYDTVTVREIEDDGIHLTLAGMGAETLPADESNTAFRAAEAFCRAAGIRPAFSLQIDKRIPFAAGMAGGSADAAGVLAALDRLTGVNLPPEELRRIGEQIGADVPFCLLGGAALATGIGTALTPLPSLPDCRIVVVKPSAAVSTAEAYRAADAALADGKASSVRRPHTSRLLEAMNAGDLAAVGRELCNVFEETAAPEEVCAVKNLMSRFHPLGCLMTGSGSAVFALFDRPADAEDCAAALSCSGLPQDAERSVFLCRPLASGPVILLDEADGS